MWKKRFLGLLLSGALLLAPARAQTYAARSGEEAFLYDRSGAVLCPEGIYSDIFPLAQGLFAAREEEGWRLLDEKGERLNEELYEDVYAVGEQLFLKKGGFYAVADLSAQPLTQHLYTQIVPNGEGGYLALKTDPNDDRGDGVYLISGTGAEQATGTVVLYGLNGFSCGLSAAVGSGGKKTGYLAPNGTWAITAQYGYGASFIEQGLAAATADSGAGVIDVQGNWIVSPKYESVSLWPGNALIAVEAADGRVGLMDARTREPVCEIESGYARTRELRDMALVTREEVVQLYAIDGQILAEWDAAAGASVRALCEGYLTLHLGEEEYLLDEQANILAGPYAGIVPLEEERFAARHALGCDLLGEEGLLLAQTEYEKIQPAGAGEYLAWIGEEAFLIDGEGQEIVKLARN
ncbi:MAG: WG repeat-containing protein [Eubacteriales bacterium]|nr:WG repeat-containing protein [Eubacteriales bacterium]